MSVAFHGPPTHRGGASAADFHVSHPAPSLALATHRGLRVGGPNPSAPLLISPDGLHPQLPA